MLQSPYTLQLRYLQTLAEIAVEHNSTILFPMPIDLLTPFLDSLRAAEAPRPRCAQCVLLPRAGPARRRSRCGRSRGFYDVAPDEQAIVLRLGRYHAHRAARASFRWHAPGIDRVLKQRVTDDAARGVRLPHDRPGAAGAEAIEHPEREAHADRRRERDLRRLLRAVPDRRPARLPVEPARRRARGRDPRGRARGGAQRGRAEHASTR